MMSTESSFLTCKYNFSPWPKDKLPAPSVTITWPSVPSDVGYCTPAIDAVFANIVALELISTEAVIGPL